MNLREYKIINNIKTLKDLAKFLEISGSNPEKLLHNWIFHKAIPSPKYMKIIFEKTNGKVMPNDFYFKKIDGDVVVPSNPTNKGLLDLNILNLFGNKKKIIK